MWSLCAGVRVFGRRFRSCENLLKKYDNFFNKACTHNGFLCIMPLPAWGGWFRSFSGRKKSSLFAKKDIHKERLCVICRPRLERAIFKFLETEKIKKSSCQYGLKPAKIPGLCWAKFSKWKQGEALALLQFGSDSLCGCLRWRGQETS